VSGREIPGVEKSGPANRILIVEDDPVSALLLRKVLEQRGSKVDHAENGVEALRKFEAYPYRIVISDWMMPEMDGIELCRKVRQATDGYVYVILLSAKSQKEDRLDAYNAGVDDFLTKPLDREELFARLKVAYRILLAEDKLRMQSDELKNAGDRMRTMNDRLILASRRFEELFSGLPVACFTFDRDGLVHEWNRTASSLFGKQPELALMKPVWEAFEQRDGGFWSQELVNKIFAGEGLTSVDWQLTLGSDERHLICNVIALHGVAGEVLGGIATNQDITERRRAEQCIQVFARDLELQKVALEEANERLATLAVTDGLTGLWNHRRFREELETVFGRNRRSDESLSVVLLDVDHFKLYNDAFGHPAGDVILQQVARIMRSSCRQYEAVARYGGEEFAIVLPGGTAEDAFGAAERIRQAIAEAEWPEREITASLGVATIRPTDLVADDVLQRADAALYASKQNGRNCVTHFDRIDSTLDVSRHLAMKRSA
jgi:two-component system cell cycle response regulator